MLFDPSDNNLERSKLWHLTCIDSKITIDGGRKQL